MVKITYLRGCKLCQPYFNMTELIFRTHLQVRALFDLNTFLRFAIIFCTTFEHLNCQNSFEVQVSDGTIFKHDRTHLQSVLLDLNMFIRFSTIFCHHAWARKLSECGSVSYHDSYIIWFPAAQSRLPSFLRLFSIVEQLIDQLVLQIVPSDTWDFQILGHTTFPIKEFSSIHHFFHWLLL